MGVPGFFSWLIKRYPLIKHMITKQQVPNIDYLYLDMNGIIYKCVKDDSIIFKSQISPKEMQDIWLDIFNYINMLVNILKPNKMIVLGLDGVAPRAKMNNQRQRRFKSSRDNKLYMEQYNGFIDENQKEKQQKQSNQNFKNNSISPGTAFMEELGKNLQFFIKKKIQQDDYWRSLSLIFTSSSSPGQGQHKIIQFIRANLKNFNQSDSHCLYGADADLIMLSMTLPLQNLCIIRQEYVHGGDQVKISQTKKQKVINFQMIFITILKQYFQIQYAEIKEDMKIQYNINNIIKDFVFLFFFIGNDFLPRCLAYNIRLSSIEDLIEAFKDFLKNTQEYLIGNNKLNLKSLTILTNAVALRESKFIDEKAQDFNKFVEGKKQFQAQFNQQIKQKNVQQQSFINQLKSYYKNNELQARNLYYGKYFNINPAQNPQQFYKILAHYLNGLQFVYQYYFINLPSWQWYYPYYCAPLVSDLFFYLNYLSSNNYQIPKIQAGVPFEPFKQLLCILPKQSCELLPQPFRKYLLNKQSILRSPIDYYPDTFQQQPYGSLRSHQYIALIPFLDLNTINTVYNQAIQQVNGKDLLRNQFQQSILYQYDAQAQPIDIQSKFTNIPNTKCNIIETRINLRDSIKWGKNAPQIKQLQQNLYKMPTLKSKQFYSTVQQVKGRKYFIIELKPQDKQKQQIKYKLDQQIFYGYPLQKSGKIQGILTKQHFSFRDQFDPYNYQLDYINKDLKQRKFMQDKTKFAFQDIKSDLAKKARFQFDWNNIQTLIFVKNTQQFVRCLDGNFKRVYYGSQNTTYQIIPSLIASRNKVYQKTMDKIQFKNIQEQFGIGQDVLIFPQMYKPNDKYVQKQKSNNSKLYIQKGKVVGHTANGKVKVKLGQKIHQIDERKLQNIVHTRDIYFTLKFCSFILQLRQQVLLTLLQTINIQISQPNFPPSIDIGLNFINRHQQKLVPNLVRINFENINIYDYRDNKQKLFKFIDISLKGLQLIIQYKKKFPKIFKFIEDRYQKLLQNKSQNGKINWRQKIRLQQIYQSQQSKQNLKSLMNVYLWLIKKQQTSMPLSSIYSKQISIKNIKKLQQTFKLQNEKPKKHKYGDPIIAEIDPNYLFSRRLATYGKMHLQKIPKTTTIRDQVLCLQPQFFGELGIVVGFDYNKFQVMFCKPSFGKNDLNGLCSQLWAGKFYERDIYNFQTWPQVMRSRAKVANVAENIGWDGQKQVMNLVPKFKQKSLRQFADIEKLAQKYTFNKQFLDFIENAKKNQKVQKIDSQYQVVDNRQKQYTLKYDKGIPSIQKQYVQKIIKDKKFMQKPVQLTLKNDINVECQKQIIQNKADLENNNNMNNKVNENKNKDQNGVKIEQPETKIITNNSKEEEDQGQEDGDDMLK